MKMWLKEEIRSSNLCVDLNLERFVLTYFPARVTQEFKTEVLCHPLRSDIIASEMVNSMLPVIDISFLHSLVTMHGTTVPTAIKCVLAADAILGGERLRQRLHEFDTSARSETFTQLWLDMGVAIREASNWLLITHGATHSLQEMVNLYEHVFSTLTQHSAAVFAGKELGRFERRVAEYQNHRLPIERKAEA